MAFGFLFDLVEHTLVVHGTESRIGAFPLGEHAAHLVVMAGMVLVLAGVVIQGSHMARNGSRPSRSFDHRRDLDAIR